MPAFWITINPSNLQNPLIIVLAGVEYTGDILSAANAAIWEAVVTSNPITVAEFFHHICYAVLHGLLASSCENLGILGDVSNHLGVVETNSRIHTTRLGPEAGLEILSQTSKRNGLHDGMVS